MLPANRDDDRVVSVQRIVDADEDALNDALTDFAVENKLEIDRSYEGDGILFRARTDAPESAMFRNKDTLLARFAAAGSGLEVIFTAEMAGLEERGEAWKRGRMIRGGIFAAVLVGAGVSGLHNGVNFGDFVWMGLGGVSMSRTLRRVRQEGESREEFQRKVANALHRVLDDAEQESG